MPCRLAAALAGLDQSELVTIPALADRGEWDRYEAARRDTSTRLSRSPGSSLFLDPQQSRIEGIGIGTGHDPPQRELRMRRVDEYIPFARRDDRGHEHCRRGLGFEPCIAKCTADRQPAFPSRWKRIRFQDQCIWNFRRIGIEGLDVIRLFESD